MVLHKNINVFMILIVFLQFAFGFTNNNYFEFFDTVI